MMVSIDIHHSHPSAAKRNQQRRELASPANVPISDTKRPIEEVRREISPAMPKPRKVA